MYVQAGAGIVADFDPEAEYEECRQKARALLRAAEEAVRFAAGKGGGEQRAVGLAAPVRGERVMSLLEEIRTTARDPAGYRRPVRREQPSAVRLGRAWRGTARQRYRSSDRSEPGSRLRRLSRARRGTRTLLHRRVDLVLSRSLSPHFRPYIEAEARPI